MAFADVIHRLQMQKPRRADFAAVGFVGAIGDEEHAKFALGGLDRGIDFARRNVEAFGIQLEVMDQRLHRGFHFATGRRGHLATRHHIALFHRQLGAGLTDDADRLAHLLHPAQIAVKAIAVLADGDLKLKLVIAFIGL